mmetsp:Transcript_45106/g.130506  ORF Transcript_45106/g.130506 Transcript_45106/m.130506 type:complete len:238 (+) Transcript_45106:776-1489(+)
MALSFLLNSFQFAFKDLSNAECVGFNRSDSDALLPGLSKSRMMLTTSGDGEVLASLAFFFFLTPTPAAASFWEASFLCRDDGLLWRPGSGPPGRPEVRSAADSLLQEGSPAVATAGEEGSLALLLLDALGFSCAGPLSPTGCALRFFFFVFVCTGSALPSAGGAQLLSGWRSLLSSLRSCLLNRFLWLELSISTVPEYNILTGSRLQQPSGRHLCNHMSHGCSPSPDHFRPIPFKHP